ncbi:SIR2 family protein [Bacillus sp. NP157]|nr:SIR2 family protein [Bacillus sp. NP157]
MRFTANGPSIPDELLQARDAGQVLFFCGAGVSMAEAKLPSFVALANRVANALGSAQNSPARRLLHASQRESEVGKPASPIPVDRLFGLLEREFEPADVRRVVAEALKPTSDYALHPHESLLALSKTRGGTTRLVTTNFDLLFEEADDSVASWAPPHLPDPRRPIDFHGIVHLHGVVTDDYQGARDDEFVLSSAEFGHAYLSDGWATRYIQTLLTHYIVVFVGYSADDPPVQYLLEALGRLNAGEQRIYAFHEGFPDEAEAQWRHRGATPMAFQGFEALWTTLSAWADRARDIDGWHERLIERANGGPGAMAPYERGMVAHIASSEGGARYLVSGAHKLPPEWLFVFDPNVRYATPARFANNHPGEEHADPYDAFHLDSDPEPAPMDPDNYYADRPVPNQAWDAFAPTLSDQRSSVLGHSARLTWSGVPEFAELPPRLRLLAAWLESVAHHPAAVWWAAGYPALHAYVRTRVEWTLTYRHERFLPVVRDAWRLVLAAHSPSNNHIDTRYHDIIGQVSREGWSVRLLRTAIGLYEPSISVSRGSHAPWSTPLAEWADGRLINGSVEYPRPYISFEFPPEHLAEATRLFRASIERAVLLEREITDHPYFHFDTTQPEEGEELDESGYKLTGRLATFTKLMLRLARHDFEASQHEVLSWEGRPDAVFVRLRIWAASCTELTSVERAWLLLANLDSATFWVSNEERDVLFVIRNRWAEFDADMRRSVEDRILHEDLPWFQERSDREEVIAYYRLNRLAWLQREGIQFDRDVAPELARLKLLCPKWTEESVQYTARPRHSKVQRIERNTDDSVLDGVPIEDLTAVATTIDVVDVTAGEQRASFSGLAKRRPVRALRSLTLAAKSERDASSAWSSFLRAQTQEAPKTRLLGQTAARLSRLPSHSLGLIAEDVAEWASAHITFADKWAPRALETFWAAMIGALSSPGRVPRLHAADHSWIDDAINSAAGKFTELLFKDSRLSASQANGGLPPDWKVRMEQMLALPAEEGLRALAVTTLRLTWLFRIDPDWVKESVLPLRTEEATGKWPFWSGFFTRALSPQPELFALLKPEFLILAADMALRASYRRNLAAMLLIAWGDADARVGSCHRVSDVELREALIQADAPFRHHTLSKLGRWANAREVPWAERVIPFLRHVWPLQRAIRGPASSSALVALAFEVPEPLFSEVVHAIVPLVDQVPPSTEMGTIKGEERALIVAGHADALLALLWKVLSEDALSWPYSAQAWLEALREKAGAQADARLAELVRRRYKSGIS